MATAQVILLLMSSMQLLMGIDFPDIDLGDLGDTNIPGIGNLDDFVNDALDNANDAIDKANDLLDQVGDTGFDVESMMNNALDSLPEGLFSEEELNQIKTGITSGNFDASSLEGFSAEQTAALSTLMAQGGNGDAGEETDHADHDHGEDADDHGSSLHVGASAAALSLVVAWNIIV